MKLKVDKCTKCRLQTQNSGIFLPFISIPVDVVKLVSIRKISRKKAGQLSNILENYFKLFSIVMLVSIKFSRTFIKILNITNFLLSRLGQ